jgi:Domain of unknown function (DUF4349)
MPRRMYPTSRRAAAVAATVGVLAAAWFTMKSGQRHVLSVNGVATSAPMTDVASELRALNAPRTVSTPPFAAAPAPVALESSLNRQVSIDGMPISDVGIGAGAEASRMIVRSGGASIEVASIDSAIPRVREVASAIGGFVANSSVQAGRDQVRTAILELKAPAEHFDQLLSGLNLLGKVESVNVSAQDVGEEYVDVEARMANNHRLEERLIELLATRTGKLKDVLDVEQELARVREEIERYEGRLRFLRSHAELSTLTITVHEAVPIIDHVSPNPVAAAARQAWRNFIALVAFAIASLGLVIPLAAVGGGLWFFLRPAKPAGTTTAA